MSSETIRPESLSKVDLRQNVEFLTRLASGEMEAESDFIKKQVDEIRQAQESSGATS